MVEFAQLRYFLAIVNRLNYGRAAKDLGIGQPVLSRSIQRLEKEVGAALFDRSRRQISLTPAGTVFAEEAQITLNQMDLSQSLARRAAEGETGRIRIGFIPTALNHRFHLGIREFRRAWPNIEISIEHIPNHQQANALEEGRIDLAFFYPYLSEPDQKHLALRILERVPCVAAVPSGWPQARKKRLRLADLAHCPFIFLSKESAPGLYLSQIAACRARGFTPNIVREADGAASHRSLVACEVGVAFVLKTDFLAEYDGITYVPFSDLPDYVYTDFAIGWIPRGMPKALNELIETVMRVHKRKGSRDA